MLATAVALAALALIAPASLGVEVEIVNSSGQPPQSVYLTLHDGSSSDGQLVDDVPKTLSELRESRFAISAIKSGRLFVSYGAPVGPAEPPQAPTRYDKIEFTNPGVANLTSVDFFAIPFELQALDGSGAQIGESLGFRCNTSTVLSRLRALAPSAEVSSGGQFVRLLSPQLSPSSYASMQPYIESMVGREIEVVDTFNGTPERAIDYHGVFEAGGSITLKGTLATPPGSTPVEGEPVHISGELLPTAIYTGNTPFEVGGRKEEVGANNAYSVIYRDIVAGFALGYWGGRYGNSTADWLGKPDFAAARASAAPYATYSEYAAIIGEYSNAYAYSFNDVGPTPVAIALNESIATLRLTIDPDQGPDTPGCLGAATPFAGPLAPLLPAPAHPAPVVQSGPARVTIASARVELDKAGRALVALRCGGDPCKGQLALSRTTPAAARARKRARAALDRRGKPKSKPEPRTVTTPFGSAEFTIAEGASAKIRVPVTAAGLRMLRAAKAHALVVQAVVSIGPRPKPTVAARRALTLVAYSPPARKRVKRRAGR